MPQRDADETGEDHLRIAEQCHGQQHRQDQWRLAIDIPDQRMYPQTSSSESVPRYKTICPCGAPASPASLMHAPMPAKAMAGANHP